MNGEINKVVRKEILILGAGFAGLNAAKELARNGKHLVNVTLIDRRNYHLFQPLLYQVATAGLSPADIATPIRSLFSGAKNIQVVLANVKSVDLNNQLVRTENESYKFDFCIMACGAKHSYFGHESWETFAPGLKTLEQATEIRRRVLLAFERAEKEQNHEKQKSLLTFVIVGGGPTGVELAGAIAELSRYSLAKDFRHIDPSRTQVILIEAGARVLASFSEKLSKRAAKDLEKLGVQVWTSTRVTDVSDVGVKLGEKFLSAATVLWAAGVQPSSLGKDLGVELDSVGRVVVEEDLSIKNYPHVFVLGDQSHFNDKHGKPLPGLAPVAMQQGIFAARNIIASIKNEKRSSFKYNDRGQMATIGRRKAVLQNGSFQASGLFAWIAWLIIHIFYLIGFRNRLLVFIQWFWSYVTFQKGARLIVEKEWRSIPSKK
jgi:NADH dehydrogenase